MHRTPEEGKLTLGTLHQTPALLGATVDGLEDIDHLLLVEQLPIYLVIVSRSEITHHVFVSEEEHDCAGIVQLVHLVEVGHLFDVANVDDGEVLDAVGNL